MLKTPTVLLESFSPGQFARSFRFEGLESIVSARTADEVVPAMAEIERFTAQGFHAAGFVCYEAAAALNPELAVRAPGNLPLVWFGIFAKRHQVEAVADDYEQSDCRISQPELTIDQQDYTASISTIRQAIATGETYQVNYTTRQRFTVSGDPFSLYRRMCHNQQAAYCSWIDTGAYRILSASPELFFALENDKLTMKPMKGTATRMPRADADRNQREQLATSSKDRAENLMIVDLVRNDLSSIAETGSVEVLSLFDVETFPTVHQMTSTVTARIRPEVSLTDIFRALFPCGSVTGAPKRHTMGIISQLETSPRGVYCGAIGYVSPGREAVFGVSIRTAVIESATGNAEIGIGSGITWDSIAEKEFLECCSKSAFMTRDSRAFQLIETLRFDQEGYLLLERHLQRLEESARYFGFIFDIPNIRVRLTEMGRTLSGTRKVRLLLDSDGSVTLETQQIEEKPSAPPGKIILSQHQVDSSDTFLYHKTTRRSLYEQERGRHPHCYDVIFLNERDEVTEGSFNTIVVSLRGELLTPALDSGLLPGVLRKELLDAGALREKVLTFEHLHTADTIWLVNSVRGWRECILTNN
jgi:para-aminobenzoate synthetase/4-amino-4-deoxychorismate lyase